MTQRVYFEEEGPLWSWWNRAPADTEQRTPDDDMYTIAHGYNMADLDRLAHMAARASFTRYGSHADRYQNARDALVDALLSATERPDPGNLLYQAKRHVAAKAQSEQYATGYDPKTNSQSKGHTTYWQPKNAPSPERAVVERCAVWQIMAALTPEQCRTLNLVAEASDVDQAAHVLGLTRNGVLYRMRAIRQEFGKLWYEHETPRIPKAPRVSTRARTHHRGRARITTVQLEEIRERCYAGEKPEDIASEYGYSAPVLRSLLTGRVKAVPA